MVQRHGTTRTENIMAETPESKVVFRVRRNHMNGVRYEQNL